MVWAAQVAESTATQRATVREAGLKRMAKIAGVEVATVYGPRVKHL
jgi:hypothetical protein